VQCVRAANGRYCGAQTKALNDCVVRMTLEVAQDNNKPGITSFLAHLDVTYVIRPVFMPPSVSAVQFHTGLGDADITLTRANTVISNH
jgi:hypothetical protein